MNIGPDRTIEELGIAGLKLIQSKSGFRYGMDSVLLADFAQIRPNDIVADFGTGTGILPLLLYGRGKGKRYHAFEIQTEMAKIAEDNAALNRIEDIMSVYNVSVEHAAEYVMRGTVDAVIMNPPYGAYGKTIRNPDMANSTARHQEENTIDRFLASANGILRGKGRLFLVYPAQQMLEIMLSLKTWRIEPKCFRLVYPYINRPANLVLIEAIKDAKPGLLTMAPLVVYDKENEMTPELRRIYHMGEE